ncbi:MAG: hypothetical protein AVDCRST_MAG95-2002 [uncultured Adhaeribacter sp.]|uniref:Uncharacterized protein n=1 Tax=uncultured Adhaeribacter sp. TaxID=448109 RepID=A0A6J4IMA5_9BACT|nr:MAG: hypothetical protein AVDCRST_MAG95-2002 [uncultured Adhaeribacter sp.]
MRAKKSPPSKQIYPGFLFLLPDQNKMMKQFPYLNLQSAL